MPLEIIYSQAAKDTSKHVYSFIKEEFGEKAAKDFLLKINKTLRSIAHFPEMFKASELGENIRIGLITSSRLSFMKFWKMLSFRITSGIIVRSQ